MTHEQHEENIGAYALGALPELETRVFERHMMGCETCQQEVRRAQLAVDALARSVPAYEAPPSLKESLMGAVNAAPTRRNAVRRLAWMPRLRPAGAFVAAALAVGFAAGSLLNPSPDPRTVAAEVDRERMPSASASLLIPDDESRGSVLRVQGMPDAGRDRVYQVWIERGGEVVPVSIFDVDSSGRGAAAIPESLEDVSSVMVTREKRGGAAAPTEPPAITADV